MDKEKLLELQTGIDKIQNNENKLNEENEQINTEIQNLKLKQTDIINNQEIFNTQTKTSLESVDKYLEKKFTESANLVKLKFDQVKE